MLDMTLHQTLTASGQWGRYEFCIFTQDAGEENVATTDVSALRTE